MGAGIASVYAALYPEKVINWMIGNFPASPFSNKIIYLS